MDDLQEKLSSSGIVDEYSSVDGLGGQISFERLVYGDSVHVGVVDEPCEYCETTLSHHQNEACAYK